MRRAANVDANQAAIVATLRSCGASVRSLAAVGQGFPDLLVWTPDRGLTLVEVKNGAKSPSRRRLTRDQSEFHATWPVTILSTTDEAFAFVHGPTA